MRRFIAVAILISAGSTGSSADDFSEIYVFGDSFSDQGNIYAATLGILPPSPPYYEGRFSDGPVWVEFLADRLGLSTTANGGDPYQIEGNNFAVGGAENARDVPVFGPITLPSMLTQVDGFLGSVPSPPADALYVMYGGYNDLQHAADPDEGFSASERESIVTAAVDALAAATADLISAGARQFLIPNVADLGLTPVSRFVKNNAAVSQEVSIRFNELLEPALDDLEDSHDIELSRLDVFALANQLVDDARHNDGARFGITNVDVPIFAGYAGSPGADPATSMFSDALHVSSAAHAWLGEYAYTAVSLDADFDGDGDVDGEDFLIWQDGFGISAGAQSYDGDADRDGDVDGQDFLRWQVQFGSGGLPSGIGGQQIPEPSAAVLVIMSVVLAWPTARARPDQEGQL